MNDQLRFEYAERWVTGAAVSRQGMDSFLHVIRAPGDPERGKRARSLGGEGNNLEHLPRHWSQVRKIPVASAREHILGLLADGKARTFNAIGVELYDKTADVLFGFSVDDALWSLVADELLEHTLDVPIRFRLRGREDAA